MRMFCCRLICPTSIDPSLKEIKVASRISPLRRFLLMPSKPLSDVLITFKRASNVPIGDIIAKSSDCYLLVHLTPRTPPSPEHPPFPLTFRTSTKRNNRNPQWDESWHLGGIPAEGFEMLIKIFDEDKAGKFDDRLGEAIHDAKGLPPATSDGKAGDVQEFVLKIKKRKASRRAYATTYLVAWCNKDFRKQRGRVNYPIRHLNVTIGCYINPKSRKVHLHKELSMRTWPNEMERSYFAYDGTFTFSAF